MTSTVEVIRGETVESRHRVSAVAVDGAGRLRAWTGDPGLVAYWRSCAKPVQAVPLLADGAADALGVTDEEIALACASHNGEPRHVAVAAGLLAKAGCTEDDLECGPHASLAPAVAREMAGRGESPRRIHSNCSGKHAAMLALARFHDWPIKGYRLPDHPVQRRILAEVARWTGVPADSLALGVDGCGVVSFALPLRSMALAYARLASGAEPASRIVRAMVSDPFLVAGTGRLCTEIVASSGGRIIAKIGADGVYCALIPELGLGVALKVEDGDVESARPAIVGVLEALAPGVAKVSDGFRAPVIRNTLGEVVGRIAARIALERAT
jgi:L-asparaginase II